MGGFRTPIPLPFSLGGGVITPFGARGNTPAPKSIIPSPLNIRKEMAQLRNGVQWSDLPSKTDPPGKQSQFGQNLMQAFSAIQDHIDGIDQRLRTASDVLNAFGLRKDPGGNVSISAATFGVRAGNQNFLLANGRMTFGAANTAPNDSDIPNSHVTIWLDEIGNNLNIRVRYSDGTLKTGVVALV